ncbi:MAG: acyl carrier protein [Rhodospirillales bacterium]|nr:acyl carrier protein [Rhodospirillales bacterium]
MTEIEGKVLDIVAKECRLDRESLTLDSKIEELDIQSVDLMQTIFQIEETFDIYVPQEDEDFKLNTLRDVTDAVTDLVCDKTSGTN